MGSQRNIFPPAIFLNLGLVLIATLFLIAYSSAYAVPLSSRADDGGDGDDERIQITNIFNFHTPVDGDIIYDTDDEDSDDDEIDGVHYF